MHWQVVVQAFRNFLDDADVFREFSIFRKYVYFFFEDIQKQVDDKENDKNEHTLENITHVADYIEVLVSGNLKWRSFKFLPINARFQAQKIISEDFEKALH